MRWMYRHLIFTIIALSLAGSFIVYGNSIGGDFVFDDVVVVQKRPDLKNSSHMPRLFIEPYHLHRPQSGLFRPMTAVSFTLNYAFFGKSPAGFHVVNIILHALASALVFWLVWHLFSRRDLAWISWLLFLVLPIHTEAVTSIVGRAEILALIFSLLCFYFSTRNRWCTAVALLFALWSKESAAMIVPLIALIHLVTYRVRLTVLLTRFAYLLIPIGVYILTRAIALKQYFFHSASTAFIENPLMFVPWHERFFTALKILILYLGKLLVPVRLSADYSYDTIHLTFLPALAGGVLLAVMIVLIITLFRSKRYEIAGYSAAFFLGFWLLASNLLVPVGTIMAERLMYAPSLGFVVLLAWGFAALARIKYFKTTSMILLVIVSLLYGGRAIARNRDWYNGRRLFAATVIRAPNSVLVRTGLGGFAMTDGRWEDARRELALASQIYPEYSHLLYLQGGLAEHDQDYTKAADFYRRSVAINPTGPAVLALANLLSIHGRFAEAEPLLKTVVELAPLDEYVIRYAYTEIVVGKPEVALEIIQRYYRNDLEDPERSAVLGTAYFQLEKYPEAIQYLQQAKKLGKSASEIDQMIAIAQKKL